MARPIVLVALVIVLDSVAGEGASDWQDALRIIRSVALDKAETDDHRANAVTAYAKLLIAKGQHDEAIKLCREILQSQQKADVADATLRAACLVERNRCRHLRAEMDFVEACSQGANAQAAVAIAQELKRATAHLDALAARPMVPGPALPRLPHWAEGLRVSPPKIEAPHWHARLVFPPLKPSGK